MKQYENNLHQTFACKHAHKHTYTLTEKIITVRKQKTFTYIVIEN